MDNVTWPMLIKAINSHFRERRKNLFYVIFYSLLNCAIFMYSYNMLSYIIVISFYYHILYYTILFRSLFVYF